MVAPRPVVVVVDAAWPPVVVVDELPVDDVVLVVVGDVVVVVVEDVDVVVVEVVVVGLGAGVGPKMLFTVCPSRRARRSTTAASRRSARRR